MNLHECQFLALRLFDEFGINNWHFRFDRSVRRFGICQYARKTISMSRRLVLLNPVEQVEDTLRHEIAHALVGPGHGHNRIWQAKAVACGAKPERCYDSATVEQPKHKWIGTCPTCGGQVHRFRRKRVACAKCCRGRFNVAFLFVWKRA